MGLRQTLRATSRWAAATQGAARRARVVRPNAVVSQDSGLHAALSARVTIRLRDKNTSADTGSEATTAQCQDREEAEVNVGVLANKEGEEGAATKLDEVPSD